VDRLIQDGEVASREEVVSDEEEEDVVGGPAAVCPHREDSAIPIRIILHLLVGVSSVD
jgi:hypothetical protein